MYPKLAELSVEGILASSSGEDKAPRWIHVHPYVLMHIVEVGEVCRFHMK